MKYVKYEREEEEREEEKEEGREEEREEMREGRIKGAERDEKEEKLEKVPHPYCTRVVCVRCVLRTLCMVCHGASWDHELYPNTSHHYGHYRMTMSTMPTMVSSFSPTRYHSTTSPQQTNLFPNGASDGRP